MLPNGQKLVTLLDAGQYIVMLPKREKDTPEWVAAAVEALLLIAATGGPPMFARIGVIRALNGRHRPVAASQRKLTKAYRSDE